MVANDPFAKCETEWLPEAKKPFTKYASSVKKLLQPIYSLAETNIDLSTQLKKGMTASDKTSISKFFATWFFILNEPRKPAFKVLVVLCFYTEYYKTCSAVKYCPENRKYDT
jgi:hypothetical protein